jgi:hypothetical protein
MHPACMAAHLFPLPWPLVQWNKELRQRLYPLAIAPQCMVGGRQVTCREFLRLSPDWLYSSPLIRPLLPALSTTQIVATSRLSCAILSSCFPQKQASSSAHPHAPLPLATIRAPRLTFRTSSSFPRLPPQIVGTCVLPEVPMRGNTVPQLSSLRNRSCLLYCCGPELLLACCQYDVPDARAVALTQGLFRDVSPKHVRRG